MNRHSELGSKADGGRIDLSMKFEYLWSLENTAIVILKNRLKHTGIIPEGNRAHHFEYVALLYGS